jgi:hypothetical protein
MTTATKTDTRANGQTHTTPNAKLRRLRELAGQSGPNIYERVSIAAELLANADFVQDRFGGDMGKAIDQLQDGYFADIGGLLQLPVLIELYEQFKESRWREWRYDLKRLNAERLKTKREREGTDSQDGEGRRGPVSHKELERVREDAKRAQEKSEQLVTAIQRAENEAKELRERVRQLELENAELRGRLKEREAA